MDAGWSCKVAALLDMDVSYREPSSGGGVSKSEAGIVVLESRAEELRRIARDLGFSYIEGIVPDQTGAIRFTFELTDEELLTLLGAVPRDLFARRAYIL
jgi:hypothetical protein